MTEKKTSEITFKEFIEEGKAIDNATINEIETDILSRMRLEGFTDEEIYNMPMPKLWDFYLEVMCNYLEESMTKMERLVEANPNLANHPARQAYLKYLKESALKESAEELEKEGKKP